MTQSIRSKHCLRRGGARGTSPRDPKALLPNRGRGRAQIPPNRLLLKPNAKQSCLYILADESRILMRCREWRWLSQIFDLCGTYISASIGRGPSCTTSSQLSALSSNAGQTLRLRRISRRSWVRVYWPACRALSPTLSHPFDICLASADVEGSVGYTAMASYQRQPAESHNCNPTASADEAPRQLRAIIAIRSTAQGSEAPPDLWPYA
jgi:hypothetical protein